MKIKFFMSFIIAATFIFNTSIFAETINATKINDKFTSEVLKEFIVSGAEPNNIKQVTSLVPNLIGEISFSDPFIIPYYDVQTKKISTAPNIWSSVVYSNGNVVAMAMFSYQNKQTVLNSIIYMPQEFTNAVNNENYAVFFKPIENTDGYDNGNLMYAINSNGDNIFLMHDSYTDMRGINPYNLQTNESDYINIATHNVISKDMKKAVTTNSTSTENLSSGDIISFKNVSGDYWVYRNSSLFIVRVIGADENGEKIYSLAPLNKSNARITISKSSKLYIRCIVGGIVPNYQVCSADNPQRVLTMNDSTVKVKNWNGQENQNWIIYKK